jgi:hypothetical protein
VTRIRIRIRIRVRKAAALLLAAGGLTAASIPAAPPAAASSTLSYFVNVFDGLCMDVSFQSLDAGAPIVQLPCNGADSQQWDIANPIQVTSNNRTVFYYELVNRHSGMCLDVPYGNLNPGQILQQWPCWGGAMQMWTITADGLFYDIVNLGNQLCVDDKDWSPNPGTGLQTWTCWHADVQRWYAGY